MSKDMYQLLNQIKTNTDEYADVAFSEYDAKKHQKRILEKARQSEDSMKAKGYKNMKLKSKFAVAAIAVIMVCSVTGFASAILNWNSIVEKKFKPNDEQKQTLIKDAVTTTEFDSICATCDGVTIKPEQILADDSYLYALFKITAPDDVILTKDTFFNEFTLTTDGEPIDASYFFGLPEDENGPIEDGTDNISYWEVWIQNNEGCNLLGKDLTFTFKDLFYNMTKAGSAKDKMIATGSWNLTWNVKYDNSMETFQTEKEVPEFNLSIQKIVLSPISISVTYDLPRKEVTQQATDQDGAVTESHTWESPAYPCGFRMKDGTCAGEFFGPASEGYADSSSNEYILHQGMSKILDVDNVKAVIFKNEFGDTVDISIR